MSKGIFMKMTKPFIATAMTALLMAACGSPNSDSASETVDVETVSTEIVETATTEAASETKAVSLSSILDAQPDAVKARYDARNPELTLGYFGIKPGMTVAEALPGGGWYSKLLLPYLGPDGHLVGIDYDIDMWAKFGGFVDDKFLEDRKGWADTFKADATDWAGLNGPKISGFAFGSVPAELENSVDAVLLIRATHHLNRFEKAHLAGALADIKTILKPDGIVGIVQHRAGEDQDDVWAGGDNGYLKQSYVIQIMEDAGFELAADPSEINANPRDKASAADEDKVWRLPPTLGTSRDNPELKAKMEAIGESDRMTLKFKQK